MTNAAFDNAEILARLGAIDLFAAASEPDLRGLAADVTLICFAAGDVVFEQMAPAADVFAVLSGQLQSNILAPSGRKVLLRTVPTATVCGALSVLAGTPRGVTVTAQHPTTLAKIPAESFLRFVASSPTIAAACMRWLALQALHNTDRVFELAASQVRCRIYSELIRLAAAAKSSEPGAIAIRPRPTHAELASMVGTGREAVTRELASLARDNIIAATRGALVIHELEYLKSFVRRHIGERPDLDRAARPE